MWDKTMRAFRRLPLVAALLAAPALPGFAQSGGPPRLSYQPLPAVTAAPPPVSPSRAAAWSPALARDLLSYVEAIGAEGLEPAHYDMAPVADALAAGDGAALDRAATALFFRLTTDLSGGYVRGADRVQWYVPGQEVNGHVQQDLLARAMREGQVRPALDSLLPTHPQYGGLKAALAATAPGDADRRDLIRANLERWRWMPRDLGARHVLVNVPAFTAAIVDDGVVTARHRTIVGKRSTPTPGLSVMATGVTFNPWWTLPQSIIRELNGNYRGYEVTRTQSGGLIVRQRPGPNNSLGRMKIEMPNAHAIFLHDTPARNLFARDVRAFSHGCVRTQDALGFAAILLEASGEWDRAAIDRAVAAGRTVTASFDRPVPVHIAYFTAAAADNGNIVTYADIYGHDARVKQALARAPRQSLASAGS